MIDRRIKQSVQEALARQAAVALIGPRQVGKTTLALQIAETRDALYLDLEDVRNRDKLVHAAEYLGTYENKLVILDEIHRVPELFHTLRGLIDQGRRRGLKYGRFLLLGSASMDLMRQSGESLAGRVAYIEMTPFDSTEISDEEIEKLWIRGGFPESFLATDDSLSLAWRIDLIRTYLERDINQLGPRIPAETLRRFWTMLAHDQGTLLNAARLAAGLEINGQTISRYLDLLVDMLLVRRLQPYTTNVGKRLIKSPRVFIRDSGLTHALLNIRDRDTLLGHPVCGGSWEGFVIENLIAAAPQLSVPCYYRTSGGAEIDLVLEIPGGELWAIEIKRSRITNPRRGFHQACIDIQPKRKFLVHSGKDRYPLGNGVDAIGLRELCLLLQQLHLG